MLRQEPSLELTDWTLSSLYLTEQEWIKKILSSKCNLLKDTPLNKSFQSMIENHIPLDISPFSSSILKTNQAWDNIWDSNFQESPHRFYLGQFKDEIHNLNLGLQFEEKDKLTAHPISKFTYFNSYKKYLLLIDKKQLESEIQQEMEYNKEEYELSQLISQNLIEECEKISKRVERLFGMPQEVDILESQDIIDKVVEKEKIDVKPVEIAPPAEAFIEPLANSIPSLFLYWYFSSEALYSKKEDSLKPIPEWIKILSKWVYRWSIIKHMTQEQIDNIVTKSPDFKTAKKYIQWHDPQEKWFYLYLPALNLFFDRFRESLRETIIDDWDDPEEAFFLTEVGLGEELDFNEDYRRPIFLYEGIPELTIGEDLYTISQLIDVYGELYREQVKKELKTDPLKIENFPSKTEEALKLIEEFEEEL